MGGRWPWLVSGALVGVGAGLLAAAAWTGAGVLALAAMVVLAFAWVVLLPGLGSRTSTRLALAAPALTVLVAALGLVLDAPPGLALALFVAVDASTFVALLVLWGVDVTGWAWVRHAVVLCAASATGFFRQLFEHAGSISISGAGWDTLPGTGSVTVVALALVALLTIGWALADRARGAARRAGTAGRSRVARG